MKYTKHKTHEGETIEGKRVIDAMKDVCNYWRKLAHEIRKEDPYAKHVTEAQKDEILQQSLIRANDLESGKINPTFTDWQRINTALTGNCVAFLP